MSGVLLYQPKQKWRVGAAFGSALLIHFAAIAFAAIHPRDQVRDVTAGKSEFATPEYTPEIPLEDPTDPPESADPTPNPVPNDNLFWEQGSTPPPIRRIKPASPIKRPSNPSVAGVQGLSNTRDNLVSAPLPEYPYEARRQKITGNGVVVITVDPVSGRVTDVTMESSTGSLILDNAAISGFRRWRFKPGSASKFRTPITFTLTGAGVSGLRL